MASAPIPMPNQLPPMPAVTRIFSRFDRDQLAGFIAVAIDLADAMDGDPDIEPNGNEEDGQFTEDEPAAKFAEMGYGPDVKLLIAARKMIQAASVMKTSRTLAVELFPCVAQAISVRVASSVMVAIRAG